MNLVIVCLAAFVGGCLAAFLGWLDSQEPFNARKFGKSVFFALSTAIVWALTLSAAQLTTLDSRVILTALASGMAVDVGTNRIIGALTPPTKPLNDDSTPLQTPKPVSSTPNNPPGGQA